MRTLAAICAVFMTVAVVVADHHEMPPPEDMPHDGPIVVLGPPEGFEPPEPPEEMPMPEDPEAAHHMMLDMFFGFMSHGDGVADRAEFGEWVWHFHMPAPPPPGDMPPPPDGEGPPPEGPPPEDMPPPEDICPHRWTCRRRPIFPRMFPT